MSEKLVKVLEDAKDRIVAKATENINSNRDDAIREMELKIKAMIEALQIEPISATDIVEILGKGGLVVSKKINAGEYDLFNLSHNNSSLIYDSLPSGRLKKGKYRITLIVEPLEEKP